MLSMSEQAAAAPPRAKALGAYYTDGAVADFLVRWAVRSPADRVLDPSFLELVRLGVLKPTDPRVVNTLRLVDKYLGLQFLQDLSEFFLAFEGLYDGFKERAGRVHALLRDPRSGFVLVASPSSLTLAKSPCHHTSG